MIRSYKGIRPRLGARAFGDDSAQAIGDVELGDDASVWMNTVVRGDVSRIRVGARTNVRDNCVLHVTSERYVGYKETYRAEAVKEDR
jgi:carbonic anhydrase/acetyltransferase-like protein (isoleucine patch superfamily)